MNRTHRPSHRTSRSGPARAASLLLTFTVVTGALGLVLALPVGALAAQPEAPGSVFVNVSATTSLSFVPDTFTVLPGSEVHLTITQLASFKHTFTLSSVANATVPSSDSPSELSAFFNAHPPVLNVSLGSTPGMQFVETFTAPSTLGTYEFLCLIHFPTMTGVMTVASTLPSSGGGSGLSTIELAGIGAVVAVAVILGAVYGVMRSRRRSRGTAPPPPPSSK